MSDQFAALVIIHDEPILRERILPKLSRIVEKGTGNHKIEIQLRIKRRDLFGHSHHLRGVLNQAPAPRVMIVARGGGATEPVAPFVQECFS